MNKIFINTFSHIPADIILHYVAETEISLALTRIDQHISVVKRSLFEKLIKGENVEKLRDKISSFTGMKELVIDQIK